MKKIFLYILLCYSLFCYADIDRTIKVAVQGNYKPYMIVAENGDVDGFGVELLNAIAKRMNFKVEYKIYNNFDKLTNDFLSNKVHMLLGIYKAKRPIELYYSHPLFVRTHSLIVRKDSDIKSIKDIKDKKIFVQTEGIVCSYIREKKISKNFIFDPDIESIMGRLSEGEGDTFIVTNIIGEYYIKNLNFDNLKNVGTPFLSSETCFGFNKENLDLREVINEGLYIMKLSEEFNRIYNKWFGIYEKKSFIEQNIKLILYGFFAVSGSLFIIFVIVWYLYTKLRKSLEDKNKELIESEKYFRDLFESSNELIFLIDPVNRTYVDVNNSVLKLFDYESKELMIGEKIHFLNNYHSNNNGSLDIIENLKSEMVTSALECSLKKNNGEILWLELYGRIVYRHRKDLLLVVGRNVTDIKKTQEFMIQTEKMMSVGGLAAGMAHEINNPLSGIISALQNIDRRLDDDFERNKKVAEKFGLDMGKMREYLSERGILKFLDGIKNSTFKASNIVKNMLEFSRKSNEEKIRCSLKDLIDSAIDISDKNYDFASKFDFRHIEIIKNYCDEDVMIKCSKQEIEQVIINILKNAAQAMTQANTKEKKLIISVDLEKNIAILKIKDNGPGMREETRKKIFDPFFTTKEVSKGTGLGLSVSYFIITENHKGFIDVISFPGKGSEFIIKLPVY